jgi:serine phosphatase RsbU (regulator of sigma subunit)
VRTAAAGPRPGVTRAIDAVRTDRRAAISGGALWFLLLLTYPLFAETADRPLAVFVLPGLLAATLGSWETAGLVGAVSFATSAVYGFTGPLGAEALTTRLLIVASGIVLGTASAAVRDQQRVRIADLHESRVLLSAFERGLAPTPLPPPGFVAVARYRPAEERMELGGDFVDAVGLPDGSLAVLVGDVCGHGPREAALGAALRAAWKTVALSGPRDPSWWARCLDIAFFRDARVDTYATLTTGYFDLRTQHARLLAAGHPPPVLLGPQARSLDLRPAPPLGMQLASSWPSADVPWAGEPVLFFTDGLIENPASETPARRWGEAGLLAWLRAHPFAGDVDAYLDTLLEAAAGHRLRRDDTAMLLIAAQHSPTRAPAERQTPRPPSARPAPASGTSPDRCPAQEPGQPSPAA